MNLEPYSRPPLSPPDLRVNTIVRDEETVIKHITEYIDLPENATILISPVTMPGIPKAFKSLLNCDIVFCDIDYERLMPLQNHIDEALDKYPSVECIYIETRGGYLPEFSSSDIPVIADITHSVFSVSHTLKPEWPCIYGIADLPYLYDIGLPFLRDDLSSAQALCIPPNDCFGYTLDVDEVLFASPTDTAELVDEIGQVAKTYNEAFLDTPFIGLQPQGALDKWIPGSYWIKSKNAEQLTHALLEQDIKASNLAYIVPVLQKRLLGDAACALRDSVFLPIDNSISVDDAEQIIDAVKKAEKDL